MSNGKKNLNKNKISNNCISIYVYNLLKNKYGLLPRVLDIYIYCNWKIVLIMSGLRKNH